MFLTQHLPSGLVSTASLTRMSCKTVRYSEESSSGDSNTGKNKVNPTENSLDPVDLLASRTIAGR